MNTPRTYYATTEGGMAGCRGDELGYEYLGEPTNEIFARVGAFCSQVMYPGELYTVIVRNHEHAEVVVLMDHDYLEPSEYAILFH